MIFSIKLNTSNALNEIRFCIDESSFMVTKLFLTKMLNLKENFIFVFRFSKEHMGFLLELLTVLPEEVSPSLNCFKLFIFESAKTQLKLMCN